VTTRAVPLLIAAITPFRRRWKIHELALFGSVLRADFRPESNVDVLVASADGVDWGLLAPVQTQQDLAALPQRPIDLISERALERSPNGMLF